MLIAILPSALNLPQSNPATTLEYAPVPPSDKDTAPPGGNLSSLGLASSGSLVGSAPIVDPLPAAAASGAGKNPRTKRCVGKPPRQSEDPLSPPCVAYFEGDNFGTTYQGVTRDEVRVLVYQDAYQPVSSKGYEPDPVGGFFDLGQPPADNEPVLTRMLRVYQRYFNDRYQTYDRFVHVYVAYARTAPPTPQSRQAEAAELFAKVKPFAVVTKADKGHEDAFLAYMGEHGVMSFGSDTGRDESFFRQFPGLVWGYLPSVQQQAKQFSAYLCEKIVPYPVSFTGNAGAEGKPRRIGLLRTDDASFQGFQTFAKLVRSQVTACGGQIVDERTYPGVGYAFNHTHPEQPTIAANNIAAFRTAGVTTVVFAQGYETEHSKAATRANWFPEWIAAGDGAFEGWNSNTYQDQQAWAHAFVVTNIVREPPVENGECMRAMQDADPNVNTNDAVYACAQTSFYTDLRQLFTGVQLSGPRLNPPSIDKGFHAIPPIASSDPGVPACFYDRDDYTCVKDSVAMWWDPNGTNANGAPGCYRMPEDGRRYFAAKWPPGDATKQRTPDDPCNGFGGKFTV